MCIHTYPVNFVSYISINSFMVIIRNIIHV